MEKMINFIVLWPFWGALAARLWKKGRNVSAAVTVIVELAAALMLISAPWLTGTPLAIDGLTGAGIINQWTLTTQWKDFCGLGLTFAADGFRTLYVLIAAFMWFVSTLFSFSYMKHYKNQDRYYFFLLFTLGATEGIFLSADFFTMFVFFELMSFASYVWVAQDERRESLRAAETYLAIAVIGGLCILMGMFLLYNETGSLSTTGGLLSPINRVGMGDNLDWLAGADGGRGRIWAAGILMLIGFGAKAGAVPFHIWLPKAHPVAPAPASALLSGVLTKTGVFGTMLLTLQIFAGNLAFGKLIFMLGILTMVTGAVLAVFSVDLKRTLACSSVSQIGFIFTGLGLAGMFSSTPTELLLRDFNGWMYTYIEGYGISLSGAVLHMVNHSLIKLALFSAVGVVFMNVHKLNLNDIRGYGRKKPLLHMIFLFGALGIAGVPLFNGYVSKSLMHEGMVLWQEVLPSFGMKTAEWLFLISGGLTAAYMAKLYVCIFIEKNRDEEVQKAYDAQTPCMNGLTGCLLAFTACLLPAIGIGAGVGAKMFTWESLGGALISLVLGAVVYFAVIKKLLVKDGEYLDAWNPKWDLEERVYRPFLAILDIAVSCVCRLLDRLPDYLVVGLRKTVFKDSPLPHELEEGDAFTHTVGVLLDDGKEVLNRSLYKKHPIQISFEHKLAMMKEEFTENNTMIARSLSFGLLLFCIGLLLTLVYMLQV